MNEVGRNNVRMNSARYRLLLLALPVLLALLGSCKRGRGSGAAPPEGQVLQARIKLADWDMRDPGQIGYVSLAVQHKVGGDRLLIRDVRRKKPPKVVPRKILSAAPPMPGGLFFINRFHLGPYGPQSGYFGTFAKAPSHIDASLGVAPDGSRALVVDFQHHQPGYAGVWQHLYRTKAKPSQRVFLDVRQARYLTFSIRGKRGGEEMTLKMADQRWEQKGDSIVIGKVSQFLPQKKILPAWQRAWIDLYKVDGPIKHKELASIVFLAQGTGQSKVYLKDLALASSPGVRFPGPARATPSYGKQRKAMWLWETAKIMASPKETHAVADFCRRHGFTDIFIQLPYKARQEKGRWVLSWDPAKLRPLVAGLHRAGVRVDALDGAPKMALTSGHALALAALEKVITYNRSSKPEERFQGIRFDIEPYLLPEFEGVKKQDILRQYLHLLAQMHKRALAAGMTLGADIPFWYDELNAYYEPNAMLEGRPFSQHILDRVDNIGLMDYRTRGYGPDGVVAHALGELRYAARRRKQVFVGLETVALPDETEREFGKHGGHAFLAFKGFDGQHVTLHLLPNRHWLFTPAYSSAKLRLLHQFRETRVSASKITFARLGISKLERVMQRSRRELSRYTSFAGFAIHSYTSFRRLSLTR